MAYQVHFGLREKPFTSYPDPRFFFLTDQHKTALEKSRFVTENKQGLGVIYGSPGTGKTTLSRILFQNYSDQKSFETILLASPDEKTDNRLLRTIIREFGVGETQKAMADSLKIFENYLLQKLEKEKKTCLVILDHAEAMKEELFGLLRQLLELKNEQEESLLQILLFGRHEMREKLFDPRSLDLHELVSLTSSLEPMGYDDMVNKIVFRMMVAGVKDHPFTEGGLREIFKISRGVPRVVNRLADKALYETYMANQSEIDESMVKKAEKILGLDHHQLTLKPQEKKKSAKSKRGRPPKVPKK